MHKDKNIIISGVKYTSLISDLRTIAYSFKHSVYNDRLSKYLNLLVDCALVANSNNNFKVEYSIEVEDNIAHFHVGSTYPFVGRFNLDEQFNERYVLDFINDDNLLNEGASYEGTLDDFARSRILFLPDHYNNKLRQYLEFLKEDIGLFRKEHTMGYCIKFHENVFTITLNNSYPFVQRFIDFKFNLNDDFDSRSVINQLDTIIELEVKKEHAHCFISLEDGRKFLETVNILDDVLLFDGKLTDVYLKNSIYNNITGLSFFSIIHPTKELELDIWSKNGINIQISPFNVGVLFEKNNDRSENFTWLRTDSIENDTLIIRQFFIIYLEKVLGYKITDLKRELQLMAMEYI